MAEPIKQQELRIGTFADGSDSVLDFSCQPCSRDNKPLTAVGFCVDCREFLCDECFRYHLKPPLTRNHKLLDIEEAKKDKEITRCQDICTDICSQHPGKVIEYFCPYHGILGCVACMNTDHRDCPEVKYISDIAEDMVNGDEYSGLIWSLDTVLLRTTCLISKCSEHKAKSLSHSDKVLKDMDQNKKDVMEAFQKMENAIQAEVKRVESKDTQKMDANIAVFTNIQHQVSTLALRLKSMKDNSQFCKLFAAMKQEKYDINDLDEKLNDAANDNDVTDYFFNPSTQLEEVVQYKDSLGKLSQHADVKSTATNMGGLNVRTYSDNKTCCIFGLASLPNDRLVAVDYNNKKVKLVNVKQAKVISEIKLKSSPYDITVTDEADEIAVTLGSHNKQLLIKVNGHTMLTQREIKTSGWCYGVASVMDNLIVSLASPERLEIIDKHGNLLKKIVHDQNGKQLFSDVCNVSFNQDKGTIYVPDSREHTLTCVSLFSKVKAVYKDKHLKVASCVAVDGKGTVYVGGQRSKNVHQITTDCRKIGILLSQNDGIDQLHSLCYSTETDCLYVGQNSDAILVYKLS